MNRRKFFSTLVGGTSAAALAGMFGPEGLMAQAREKARPLNLKVTDLKTFLVNGGEDSDENYVFVKIYTNQGIVGLGEGTLPSKGATVAQAIEEHKRYLMGKDPTEIERHWQAMFRGPRYRGGPVLMSAISAVEIALWDILGQALGQPIWQLLGGKARDKVLIYPHPGSLITPEERKRVSRVKGDAEGLAEKWLIVKENGWKACKGGILGTSGGRIDPHQYVEEGIRNLKAVREAVGDDFKICIDMHGQATLPMAVEFCTRAEEYRPYFVEEATQLEDLGELAHLRSKTKVPLATGERHLTKYAFTDICSRHLVDYVQPDVVHCGGISEMKKIAAIAEAHRIDLAPHNPQSRVCTFASMHVSLSTPNASILEISSGERPMWDDLFYGTRMVYEDGFALPPERPGLGIELDEKVAARSPYGPKHWRAPSFEDGSISDR